jgi:predicted DNA-binding transcriptional regulator YafY
MSTKLTHLHYIFEIIKNNPGITKADLLSRLKFYGSPTTERTLERDFFILRDQYEIDIVYDASVRGYVIDEESNPDLRTFENFAKTQVLGGMLNEMLIKGTRVWEVVDIDDQVPIMQVEYLKAIIEAIIDKKQISVTYRKFFEKEPETYVLEPHLIRQALKRWYVIAGDASTSPPTIKTFGLERILSVQRLQKTFTPNTKSIKERCRTVYGISGYNGTRELVILETSKGQGKYFETLPIHPSQQVEYLPDDLCQIKLNVAINAELIQLIASQLKPIRVLAPAKLKADYKDFIMAKMASIG